MTKSKDYEKNGWRKYEGRAAEVFQFSDCFYQKKITDDTSAEIVQYTHERITDPTVWELRIQIHEDQSIIGETINVKAFAYTELDFDKIEKHARVLIKVLEK